MEPETISAPHFINPSHQSVCLYLCIPLSLLVKTLPRQLIRTQSKTNIVRVVFCALRNVSEESLWVFLLIPLSLLGNGSVNTFPRQRRIVGGVVSCAAHIVSKESRRLVLTGISCSLYYAWVDKSTGARNWSLTPHRVPTFNMHGALPPCRHGVCLSAGATLPSPESRKVRRTYWREAGEFSRAVGKSACRKRREVAEGSPRGRGSLARQQSL
jgi:hypothetical protein